MKSRTLLMAGITSALVTLAACTPADTGDDAAPETAATQTEAEAASGLTPEPSVGAPPPEGGGVPGAAEGNPAAAPSVSTPPRTEAEQDQIPD